MSKEKLFSPCDTCPHNGVPHGMCLSCTVTDLSASVPMLRGECNRLSLEIDKTKADKDALREALRMSVYVFDEMDSVHWNDDSEWQCSSYETAADQAREVLHQIAKKEREALRAEFGGAVDES